MKTSLLSFVVVGLLTVGAMAQAPINVGPGNIKLGKVAPAVIKSPEYQILNGPQKRYKLGNWLEVEVDYETNIEDIDELTFEFTIAVEGKLLTGNVTYINIPKGREHFGVVYVAPRTLDKLTGGKPLTGSSIENAWVVVKRQGQELGRAAYKPTNIPNLPQLPGLVLNKNETPFAPLFYDRYETIKATR